MKFRTKTILGIALIETVLLAILISFGQNTLKDLSERDTQIHAQSTAQLFSVAITDSLLSEDLATLEALANTLLSQPRIRYVMIWDADDKLIIQHGDDASLSQYQKNSEPNKVLLDDTHNIENNITISGSHFGRIAIGYSLREHIEVINIAENRSWLIALLEISLVAIFSWILGSYLTRQLKHIKRATEEISKGNLGFTIATGGNDELGQAAAAFNKMSKQLKQQEQLQQRMRDTALDAIIQLDRNGRIINANPMAEKLFGMAESSLYGRHFFNLFKPGNISFEHGTVLSKHNGVSQSATGTRHQTQINDTNGNRIPVEISIADDIDNTGFNLFIRDLTQENRSEHLKTEFISVVSHELRTPLTAISGALKIIDGTEKNLSSEGEKLIEIALRNSQRLNALINDILDTQKIESGAMKFNIRPLDLNRFMHDACEDNATFAHQFKVEIKLSLPDKNSEFSADLLRMRQVMSNLISNAVKHSEENSAIDIRAYQDDIYTHIEVEDYGAGIPEDFHDQIFNKFSQAENSATRKHPGTGLGLSLCKLIVEQHDGDIRYESELNKGTRFIIRLPRLTTPRDTDLSRQTDHE